MIKPGRPTQRLLSSLSEDWGSAEHRAAAALPLDEITVELHELDHPVIVKARHDFDVASSVDSSLKREGITDLKNPMWWKLKTGRWRGAVYQDESGQAWICAAGYRRGKESTDFYQSFMAEVKANGPDQFLPTKDDRDRLSDEVAEVRFREWESDLQTRARSLVAEAQQHKSVSESVLDPDEHVIGELTYVYDEIEIDGDIVVELDFRYTCSDWAQSDLFDWVEQVMCLAIDPREQEWRPTSGASGRSYSFMLDASESSKLFRGLEEPFGPPGESRAGDEAHFAHRGRLTESTVNGEAIMGLCGKWFVPRQDHENKPSCRHCDGIYRGLPAD